MLLTASTYDYDTRADSSLAVQAPASATLYIGAADVTPVTGWPVAAGQAIAVDIQGGERLYGVLATGTGTAYVLRTGV